jgi:hypothetical protein
LPNLWELLLAIIAIFENRILVQYNGGYPDNTSFQMTRCSLTTFQVPGSLIISSLLTKNLLRMT